jgi:cyclase
MDIVASLYQRNIDFDQLQKVTEGIFIPITVGGGIRTIQDINNVLRAGADKVAINTHAVHNPEFLKQAVAEFGSQCIVLSVEAKKLPNGTWEAYTDGGREQSGRDVVVWVQEALQLGVGEILLTSIDFDGTRRGYDLELANAITGFTKVPVVLHGGAADPASMESAVLEGKVDAVAASSIFHYNDYTIGEVKSYLQTKGINVRMM